MSGKISGRVSVKKFDKITKISKRDVASKNRITEAQVHRFLKEIDFEKQVEKAIEQAIDKFFKKIFRKFGIKW